MVPISMRERAHEIRRDRSARRLCCADLADDGRGLVRHHSIAPSCRPLRLAATRVASSPLRVRCVHHRSVVLDIDRRTLRPVMTVAEITSKRGEPAGDPDTKAPLEPERPEPARGRIPRMITLATIALAVLLGWAMWTTYMGMPWTRAATVRAYVVTMAPEVAGHIVELPIGDNKYVHKGDLLMVIDPTNYTIAVSQAEAGVQQAEASVQNIEAQIAVQQAQISANEAQVD